MLLFSYFIIQNTNDVNDFHIELTSMKDWRLRFSAIKSEFRKKSQFTFNLKIVCKNENENGNENENEIPDNAKKIESYLRIFRTNYCFYLLEKRTFSTVQEALMFRDELIKLRLEKFEDTVNQDKFRLVFI